MRADLVEVLEEARALGFLGPGDVHGHIEHAHSFSTLLQGASPPFLDLGAGGGLPGLVLAVAVPSAKWMFLDSEQRRCRFLERASARLDVDAEVLCGRAEQLGRDPRWRGKAGAVTARSFGSPGVTAECAAPFLRVGGILVVAEPPGDRARWPPEELARLGLRPGRRLTGPPALQLLEQTTACPDEFPRRVGVPARRPLF